MTQNVTLAELDAYFREYLQIDAFPNDPSQNGIQVANSAPREKPIKKAAFAVDACLETIERAAACGADMLFVHHGLLWGQCEPISGIYYRRIKALLNADLALYACHLPLDAHPVSGNNYGLASRLGLVNLAPFGEWRGATIGVQGELPTPLSPDKIVQKLFDADGCAATSCVILPFGILPATKVAIVSGGAGDETAQAAAAGADVFITGEIGHEQYHLAEESGITVIAAGHYRTETVGVSLMAKKLADCFDHIETVFIDLPTGL